jgi:hypothetical protein
LCAAYDVQAALLNLVGTFEQALRIFSIQQLAFQMKGGYQQINKALNACAFEDYLCAQLQHLPKLADVEQISPRVLRVLGQNAGKVKKDLVICRKKFTADVGLNSLPCKERTHISLAQARTG